MPACMLRAEFVSDEDTRQKLLASLNEMQAMTEATLTFAREDATRETRGRWICRRSWKACVPA